IAGLGLDMIAGTPGDLADLVVAPGVQRTIEFTALDEAPKIFTHEAPPGTAGPLPGVAVRMLTSGTTGPPKRVELRYSVLGKVMADAKHYERDKSAELRLRKGVAIVNSPLVH